MGYILNQLSNLPIDENINFYVFVVNGRYRDPLYEVIQRNFFEIAREFGDNAVVAMGTDSKAFSTSVARKYLGEGNSDASFTSILPALLITNDHPDELDEYSMRLVVPLKHAEEHFGNWHGFFDCLAKFARGESDEFAKRFENKENLLDATNKMMLLQPNLFGLGVNINALVERWQKSNRGSTDA